MKKEIYVGEKNINDLADRIGRNVNRFARNIDSINTFKQ
jgi:hypothetical protein